MDKLNDWIKSERGRLSRLAEALGITPSAIAQWDKVPAERLGDVSRLTGISMAVLRPDIFASVENAA